MPNIKVNDDTYDALKLRGTAWKITPADAVDRLANALARDAVARHDYPSSPRDAAGDAAGEQVARCAGGNTHS